MAIKKFNRKENDPDYFSKTQQKNESIAIKKFGETLLELSTKNLAELPLAEVTLKSLLDYKKMTTNLARKRHLMFIGKCLRQEDENAIREVLQAQSKASLVKKATPFDKTILDLLNDGEATIEKMLEKNLLLERQILRQLLRNIKNSKDEKKKLIAINKMKNYLNDIGS